MFQKRRIGRLQRTLSVEALEDRTLLSGNVIVSMDGNGQLLISGDDSDNGYQINQTMNLGVPTLSVHGLMTDINTITNGTADFPLSSVSNLIISDGNGNNTILVGNVNGFVIPGGNITFDVGAGTDNIQLMNITATVGSVLVNGAHGPAAAPAINGGTDTINYTNVLAVQSAILPGAGPLTINQTNVTLGLDAIYGAGGGADTPFPAFGGARVQTGNDNIRIINSLFHPLPRIDAIHNLKILDGNANNTFFIDSIDVGLASITSGDGNNTLTFSHSLDLQADIVLGTEVVGARGNNKVTMDTDVITGQHVLMQVLNESGVGGFLNTPGATTPGVVATTNNVAPNPDDGHRSPRHINNILLNNLKFTTAFPILTPQLGVRMDDGDYYYDSQRGKAIPGSTFVATQIDLPGIMQVNLGDHMQNVQLGQLGALVGGIPGVTDTGDVDVGLLNLSAANDLDTVILAADVTGQFLPVIGLPAPLVLPAFELVQLGDNTINPVQGTLFGTATNDQLPLPYVFTSGQVGTLAIDGNMRFTIGNNLSIPGFVNGSNAGELLGWPVKQSEKVLGHLAHSFLSGNLLDTFTPSVPAPVGGPTPFVIPSTLPKLEAGQNGGLASQDYTDNGLALFITSTIVQGDLRIYMDNGGFNHRESLVMYAVTAGNVFVEFNSDAADARDGNPFSGVYIALDHVVVTDTIFGDFFDDATPGLTLTDIGHGQDFVYLGLIPAATPGFGFDGGAGPVAGDFLFVAEGLLITLSDHGGNDLSAHNTTAGFGLIDGGAGPDNHYHDLGNNIGFELINFCPP